MGFRIHSEWKPEPVRCPERAYATQSLAPTVQLLWDHQPDAVLPAPAVATPAPLRPPNVNTSASWLPPGTRAPGHGPSSSAGSAFLRGICSADFPHLLHALPHMVSPRQRLGPVSSCTHTSSPSLLCGSSQHWLQFDTLYILPILHFKKMVFCNFWGEWFFPF